MNIPNWIPNTAAAASEALRPLSEGASDLVESVGKSISEATVEGSIIPVQGPWIKLIGDLGDGSGAGRIDDAPGFEGRLLGPEENPGTLQNPGTSGDPASRSGSTLIGIEAGLLRFLDVNFEAVSDLGRVYAGGSIDFAKFKAEIFYDPIFEKPSFSIDDGNLSIVPNFEVGIRLGGQVLVELIGAHYEVGYDTPTVNWLGREVGLQFTGRLDAAVHAFARAWLDVSVGTRSAIMIGGKAFAGASATLAGQAELAPFAGVYGSVTGWAGVGAGFELGVQADFVNHQYGFKNSAGVALGVGASYDWGFSVDALEIATLAWDVVVPEDFSFEFPNYGGDIAELIGWLIEVAGDVAESGMDALSNAPESASDVAQGATDAANAAAGTVADAVCDVIEDVFGWYGG